MFSPTKHKQHWGLSLGKTVTGVNPLILLQGIPVALIENQDMFDGGGFHVQCVSRHITGEPEKDIY